MFEIRTYEIDHRNLLTLPSLIRLMQEAAMQNVIKLEVSVWHLAPHHISWVLLHQDVKINALPKQGDRVKIFTTPAGFVKFYTYRDYYLLNEAGQVLAYSSSKWLLLNTQTRRPSRIPPFLWSFQERMPPQEDCLPQPVPSVLEFEQPQFSKKFEVGWHDLDFNQHLNNTIYLKYMLETLPKAVLDQKRPSSFTIQFKLEAGFQDSILAESMQVNPTTFNHRLIKEESGKELAVAQSVWVE